MQGRGVSEAVCMCNAAFSHAFMPSQIAWLEATHGMRGSVVLGEGMHLFDDFWSALTPFQLTLQGTCVSILTLEMETLLWRTSWPSSARQSVRRADLPEALVAC